MLKWALNRFQQREAAARVHPETAEEEIPGFWIGPYGTRIPLHTKCIKSPDRINTISRTTDSSGTAQVIQTTLVPTQQPMSAADYRATYCQKIGGDWYYTGSTAKNNEI